MPPAPPAAVRRHARVWGVTLDRPLAGGASGAHVWSGRYGSEPVVLKVDRDDRCRTEAAALRAWPAGVGPELFELADDGSAMLVEMAGPGTTLRDLGAAGHAMLDTLAATVARLHAVPVAGGDCRELLAEMCSWVQQSVDAGLLPARLASRARALAGDLDPSCSRLAHGDLQLGNVLVAGDRVVLIDPGSQPVPPAADLGKLVGTDRFALGVGPDELARRLAAPAGVDVDQVLGWARMWALGLVGLFLRVEPATTSLRTRVSYMHAWLLAG